MWQAELLCSQDEPRFRAKAWQLLAPASHPPCSCPSPHSPSPRTCSLCQVSNKDGSVNSAKVALKVERASRLGRSHQGSGRTPGRHVGLLGPEPTSLGGSLSPGSASVARTLARRTQQQLSGLNLSLGSGAQDGPGQVAEAAPISFQQQQQQLEQQQLESEPVGLTAEVGAASREEDMPVPFTTSAPDDLQEEEL